MSSISSVSYTHLDVYKRQTYQLAVVVIAVGCWILDTGYLLLDTCYLLLDTCYSILDTCYLILATWYLLLDTCYSILDTCYLLLASVFLLLHFDTGQSFAVPQSQLNCTSEVRVIYVTGSTAPFVPGHLPYALFLLDRFLPDHFCFAHFHPPHKLRKPGCSFPPEV